MAVDDFLDAEVAVAVAATAALASPRVRGIVRRGAVYGLAGLLAAGDTIASLVRGIAHSARQSAATAAPGLQDITDQSNRSQMV